MLQNRPQKILHGDVHLNNILLTEDDNIYLIDLEDICIGDPLYDLTRLLSRDSRYFAFNKGVLSDTYSNLTEEEWEIMALYYCIRKLEEYMYNINSLPDFLASEEGWKERYGFLTDPAEMKKAFMPDDSCFLR